MSLPVEGGRWKRSAAELDGGKMQATRWRGCVGRAAAPRGKLAYTLRCQMIALRARTPVVAATLTRYDALR